MSSPFGCPSASGWGAGSVFDRGSLFPHVSLIRSCVGIQRTPPLAYGFVELLSLAVVVSPEVEEKLAMDSAYEGGGGPA